MWSRYRRWLAPDSPGQNSQKCGFSGTVGTDQAITVAFREFDVYIFEQCFFTDAERHIIGTNHFLSISSNLSAEKRGHPCPLFKWLRSYSIRKSLILQGLLEILFFSPFFQVFVYNDSNCIEICRFLTASLIFIFVQIKEVHYAHIHRDHYGPPVLGQYTPGRAEHEAAL